MNITKNDVVISVALATLHKKDLFKLKMMFNEVITKDNLVELINSKVNDESGIIYVCREILSFKIQDYHKVTNFDIYKPTTWKQFLLKHKYEERGLTTLISFLNLANYNNGVLYKPNPSDGFTIKFSLNSWIVEIDVTNIS